MSTLSHTTAIGDELLVRSPERSRRLLKRVVCAATAAAALLVGGAVSPASAKDVSVQGCQGTWAARRWQIRDRLAEFHDRLRDRVRQKEGRLADPSAAIVYSESVRAASNIPRSTSGWDGGKRVGGRKRHLVVDCLGLAWPSR